MGHQRAFQDPVIFQSSNIIVILRANRFTFVTNINAHHNAEIIKMLWYCLRVNMLHDIQHVSPPIGMASAKTRAVSLQAHEAR